MIGSMSVKRERTIIMWILFFVACHISAASLVQYEPELTEQQILKLKNGEVLSHDSTCSNTLGLTPKDSLAAQSVAEVSIEESTLFTECLSLIPYPEYFSELTHDEQLLHIFNTLRSISTQEGITYISYRRGNKPALLIKESHFTDRIGSRKVLEDPVEDSLPAEETRIVFQEDTSFKGNYYEYRYRTSQDEILQLVTNKTDLKVFGIIPAIRKNVMKINTSLIITDEGILAYSLAVAPHQRAEIKILWFSVHLPSAFQRRIVAVQEWLMDQLHKGSEQVGH